MALDPAVVVQKHLEEQLSNEDIVVGSFAGAAVIETLQKYGFAVTVQRFVLTRDRAPMPCCGADGNAPGTVKMTGWAFIPDTLTCEACGAKWAIVSGAEFGGLDPNGIEIERAG